MHASRPAANVSLSSNLRVCAPLFGGGEAPNQEQGWQAPEGFTIWVVE